MTATVTPKSTSRPTPVLAALVELLRTKTDPTCPDSSSGKIRDTGLAELALSDVDAKLDEFQEDEIVGEFLKQQGVDLKEHARRVEQDLREAETEHLECYYQNRDQLQGLEHQIHSCDGILRQMEHLLTGFQTKLDNINQEIRDLQDQSLSMNRQWKNRLQVESRLTKVIDGLAVSPKLIQGISEAEVGPVYVTHVEELDRKLRFARHQANQPVRMAALRDVEPELERLRLVASAKIRHFFLTKIKSLRTLATNIQILQRSVFLRCRALNHFLIERHNEAACEVRDTYIYTARLYFAEHFELYCKELQKLKSVKVDRFDLLGQDESSRPSGFFGSARMVHTKDPKHVFSLGERVEILTQPDPRVIIPHVAEEGGHKYPFETLFRSYNLALSDNTTSEYEFLLQFFTPRTGKHAVAAGADITKAIYDHIFESVCTTGLGLTKQFVESTYDALGILLCVRINQQLANELQRRRIPVLEGYINATNMLLWPRFQAIVNMHLDSMKKVCVSPSVRLAKNEVHPHFVTRRYAEFVASLLTLNQSQETSVITQSIQRLRDGLEAMLLRISEGFGDRVTTLIFLINNYDLIITILNENGHQATSEEVDYFAHCRSTCISEYVEEQLDAHFGYLKKFVLEVEAAPNYFQEYGTESFEPVITEFNTTFRTSLANINATVIRNFSNFKNGTTILHSVLGQLLLYYNRFHHFFDQRFARKPTGSAEATRPSKWPVGVQNVMVEIKKYKSNF
ncbi:Vacuolar protein sorting-associated protein 52 [Dispira simplex]|nr:Vacuolar protein sorting-associated protein 52 [Dispira simplex]